MYESRELFVPRGEKAFEVKQSVLSPYTWGQVQIKGGVANIGGKPGAFITSPLQFELGFIAGATTNPQMPNPPSTDPVDYRIVNGVKTGDPVTIARQFSDVRRRFGLTLNAESVLPQWDAVTTVDRSAGVWVQVPAQGRWTAETMARKLNEIGTAMPAYKELKFVTAKSLLDNNPSLRSGTAQPGAQLNTGLRVAVGGPGLFLPDTAQ